MNENDRRPVSSASPSCWVVSDGKAGMENQCLGLAEALGVIPVVKRIKLRSPWKQLSPFLRCGLSWAVSPKGDPIAPPWPDLLIASGRASVPASLYVRRKARQAGGRGTFTVQIQNPVIDASHFDLVIAPRHDQIIGPNVMSTRGSLHRMTAEKLAAEGAKLLPRIEFLPRPYTAVVLGGSSSAYSLTPREAKVIGGQLAALAAQGTSLLVTASRRTGAENLSIIAEALRGTNAFIWDGKGDNPYFGMMGVADAFVVTCESTNLISEACFTGKPVMVIHLPGGSEKFRRFHQAMRDDGMIRPFKGKIESYTYAPLDDMSLIAARVREMMAERLKSEAGA